MPIYNTEKQLKIVDEIPFKFEKDIQKLVEENLVNLLNLRLIKSEFALNNFRIDSLCFDDESKSFVIIEFKRDKNFSVIDQGYAYLSLMLNNKADFILEYNENQFQNHLKRQDVDWTQSKIIFISPSFTNYQREAINFKDLPIELWEIKKFQNNTISFEQIQKNNAKESIKTISKNNIEVEMVSQEIKVFSEADHLQKGGPEISELFENLKNRIQNLDSHISFIPKKLYIASKLDNKTICDIVFLKKSLKIFLNLKSGELKDSQNIARDVSNVGHWGNGSYEIIFSDFENIDYLISLIKQSLDINKNR